MHRVCVVQLKGAIPRAAPTSQLVSNFFVAPQRLESVRQQFLHFLVPVASTDKTACFKNSDEQNASEHVRVRNCIFGAVKPLCNASSKLSQTPRKTKLVCFAARVPGSRPVIAVDKTKETQSEEVNFVKLVM